jgi:hypothetical protein
VSHERNAQPLYVNVLGKIHLIKPQKNGPVRSIRLKDSSGKYYTKSFTDYVQVFYNSGSDPDIVDPHGVTHVKYTVEEAKLKFGLYDTYAEALNSKSSDVVRKEELLKLSHQLEVVKHQNTLDKIEAESRLEAIKNENNIFKQELDKEALNIKVKQSTLDTQILALENQKKLLEISRKQMEETMQMDSKRFEEQLRKIKAQNDEELNREIQRNKDARETKQNDRKDLMDLIKYIPATIIGIGAIAALMLKMNQAKNT